MSTHLLGRLVCGSRPPTLSVYAKFVLFLRRPYLTTPSFPWSAGPGSYFADTVGRPRALFCAQAAAAQLCCRALCGAGRLLDSTPHGQKQGFHCRRAPAAVSELRLWAHAVGPTPLTPWRKSTKKALPSNLVALINNQSCDVACRSCIQSSPWLEWPLLPWEQYFACDRWSPMVHYCAGEIVKH